MEPKSCSFVNDIIANIIDKKIVGVSIQVEASRQAPYLLKSAPNRRISQVTHALMLVTLPQSLR